MLVVCDLAAKVEFLASRLFIERATTYEHNLILIDKLCDLADKLQKEAHLSRMTMRGLVKPGTN